MAAGLPVVVSDWDGYRDTVRDGVDGFRIIIEDVVYNFAAAMKAPLALRDLGLKESDLDRAADLATQNPYWNPRPIDRNALRQLLQAAWAGDAPAV